MKITIHVTRILASICLAAATLSTLGSDELFKNASKVHFESVSFEYQPTPFAIRQAQKKGQKPETKTESSVPIFGYLEKPNGDGPFPAVVLLHTCYGLSAHDEFWSKKLVGWGYVVLTVDSLSPRGIEYLCDGRSIKPAPWHRALDGYGAKAFLSRQPFIDENRIGVMGMSHGGMALLEIIKQSTLEGQNLKPFDAAVAYYPLCGSPEPHNTPTLILIGSEDSWTPAIQCEEYLAGMESPHQLELKVFPGAHHLFDYPDIDTIELGKIIRSDPVAAVEADKLVEQFFNQYLQK